jgi:hypothetical protein
MPVDPTVPSKIRDPVYGRKSPSLSASSITSRGQSTRRRAFSNPTVEHTSECDTILDATPWVEILKKRKRIDYQKTASPHMPHTGRTSAFPRISTPNALLNELIRTSGVFPLRGVQMILSGLEDTESRTDSEGRHLPIRPVTPSSTSSLRNSMGLRSTLVAELSSFLFL